MIRSELDVLPDKVQEPSLRANLQTQFDRVSQRRTFGLVFERHIPERVRLPQHPIRVGSQVVSKDDDDSPTREVLAIADQVATVRRVRDRDGTKVEPSGAEEQVGIDSIVVITDFGEAVLPGFRHLGSVDRGGDKPYHVVINGENHHALEALRFTHAGKIDCIYIDPPYNSGARDWKYNNDYVDGTDAYRHSKWLAFMERRLMLAKALLNPVDSVLIVTIDENEVHRIGLLLEQTFPSTAIQMVSVAINPAAVARKGFFSRSDEFYFFVRLGRAGVAPTRLGPDWITTKGRTHLGRVRWDLLRRSGSSPQRLGHPDTFYPIFVESDGRSIHSVSRPMEPVSAPRATIAAPPGTVTVWPIRSDGSEGRWSLGPHAVSALWKEGYLRIGEFKGETTPIYYLAKGETVKIETGLYQVVGRAEDGSVITSGLEDFDRALVPGSQWHLRSHDSTQYGSRLLAKVLPGRAFPFPKSLYAVEDALRFFVKDKPDAVVMDFFAGSGTTAHAVMRLNRQDGGRRQSILVTNKEVSAEEATSMRDRGLHPGDRDWEAQGIFEQITRPRVTAALTGRTPEGDPIAGDYKFTDTFPMSEGFEERRVPWSPIPRSG